MISQQPRGDHARADPRPEGDQHACKDLNGSQPVHEHLRGHRNEVASREELLTGVGYRPEPDGQGGFVLMNCPFHRLADGHAEVVCAMNGAFLSGALAGYGLPEENVEEDRSAGRCCARIRQPQAGQGASGDR